jgi:alpha-galactosidase/6-phospho-beta-glucosidase family protein
VPWFIKSSQPDLLEQYEIPIDEYITRCELQIAEWEADKAALERGELDEAYERSQEYGSLIIHSMETGTPRVSMATSPTTGSSTISHRAAASKSLVSSIRADSNPPGSV